MQALVIVAGILGYVIVGVLAAALVRAKEGRGLPGEGPEFQMGTMLLFWPLLVPVLGLMYIAKKIGEKIESRYYEL